MNETKTTKAANGKGGTMAFTDEQYRSRAHELYGGDDGSQVDTDAAVSQSGDGAWVAVMTWISNDEMNVNKQLTFTVDPDPNDGRERDAKP